MNNSFGYGDKFWPNLESLTRDAAKARHFEAAHHNLEAILGAAASESPIRVSKVKVAVAMGYHVWIGFDPSTDEYIIRGLPK